MEKHVSDSERVKEEIKNEKFKKNESKHSRFKLKKLNFKLSSIFFRNGKSVEDFEQPSIVNINLYLTLLTIFIPIHQ